VKWQLPFVAAVALVANFAYFIASNGDYTYPDSATYLHPSGADRTPVYPLLIAPFRGHLAGIVIAQHLLNVALAIAIFLFLRKRGAFIATLASLFLALDTPTIHYANKVLTETLFTAALFALFVMASRRKVSGMLCGLLTLIRPIAIAYFAVAAIFTPRKRVAAFIVAALLLPTAWAVRNRVEYGVLTVSTIAGNNMLLYRAAGALAILDEGDFDAELRDRQKELQEYVDDEEKDDTLTGLRIVALHPVGLALLTARGIFVNLFDSDWDAMMIVSRIDESLIRYALNAWTHALIFLAIAGLAFLWRRERDLALLIAATIGYFVLISAGGEAEARFRVPVVPQIAIAAAFGVDAIRRLATRSDQHLL
jgi:hypothetical protein